MDARVVSGGRTYEVGYDRDCATLVMVRGAVLDDAGLLPVALPYRVTVDEPLLSASGHAAGYALAGDPDVALADRSVPHALAVAIEAAGFRRGELAVTVPANPVLPMTGPAALLRRPPVALRGRVQALATGDPIAGASLSLIGPSLPPPQRAVLLTSPLARPLSAAASLRGRSLTAVSSPVPVKTASAEARAGVPELVLDDRQGLAPGQLLRLGPPERAHFVEIAALPATPAGLVALTAPLARTVRPGDPAAPFAPGGGSGPTCHPVGAAFAGEGVLILDTQPTGAVLRILDPPSPIAWHARDVTTGADGGYVIAGLARLQSPMLRAAAAGFTAQTRSFPVPWEQPFASLDWRLSP